MKKLLFFFLFQIKKKINKKLFKDDVDDERRRQICDVIFVVVMVVGCGVINLIFIFELKKAPNFFLRLTNSLSFHYSNKYESAGFRICYFVKITGNSF